MVAARIQEQSGRFFHGQQRDRCIDTLVEWKLYARCDGGFLVESARFIPGILGWAKPGSLVEPREISEACVGIAGGVGVEIDAGKLMCREKQKYVTAAAHLLVLSIDGGFALPNHFHQSRFADCLVKGN